MYAKTAIEMINSAIMISDFFEPVDRFKKQPAANKDGQQEDCSDHFILFLITIGKADTTKQEQTTNNCK